MRTSLFLKYLIAVIGLALVLNFIPLGFTTTDAYAAQCVRLDTTGPMTHFREFHMATLLDKGVDRYADRFLPR